ncbi:MAG: hypothetical protein HOI95_00885 [Chromatiales bacterium]|nr:hypothetical protein [Chromatiales bacterium]
MKRKRIASSDIPPAVVIDEYERVLVALRGAGARLPELSGTRNVARHLCAPGAVDDARRRLDHALNWFTQGHNAPILKSARKMLEDLSSVRRKPL